MEIKPDYYHKGGIDVISFAKTKLTDEEMRGFYRMNVLKYISRYRDKNGVEDLKKARGYLDNLIELEEIQ